MTTAKGGNVRHRPTQYTCSPWHTQDKCPSQQEHA